MMKTELRFNEKKYEYDLYNLVRAFFPFSELSITYETEGEASAGGPGAAGPADNAGVPEETVLRVTYGEREIRVSFSDRETGRIIFASQTAACREDRIQEKNQLKKLVYSGLSRWTGRELPWGDLCGIRPVRLMTGFLEKGLAPEDAKARMMETYAVGSEKASLALEVAMEEQRLLRGIDTKDGYSLYVHVPFCPSICLYCTFGSHPIGVWSHAVEPYLEAVGKELQCVRELTGGRAPSTVYVGGGTPTALPPEALDKLLGMIREAVPFPEGTEWTVEAGRPDTITGEILDVLRTHPVTRISVNPQTMNEKTLRLIGRNHTPEDVARAFLLAREKGFDNINMDMIAGLPGEDGSHVRATLEALEALGPDSFTVHALALKRASRLREEADRYRDVSFRVSDEVMKCTEDAARRMEMRPYYLYRQKNIAGNYENVGYAKEGRACLYNILIMEEKQTIIGVGPGASTKLYRNGLKAGRAGNVKNLGEYLERIDEMLLRKRDLFLKRGE